MKSKTTLKSLVVVTIVILFTLNVKAQVPQSINYQAVLRNASGSIMQNQNVTMKFTIHKTTPNGTIAYEETQGPIQTNNYGLVNLQIGQGASTGNGGSFISIKWGLNSYFLQVWADPGTGYISLGTTQFISVPYAMVADTVLHGGGGGDNWGSQTAVTNATLSGDGTSGNPLSIAQQGATTGQVLSYNGTNWAPTTISSGSGWALTGNSGTISGTNFIGTTDSVALDIRTKNILKFRITPKGQIETFNTGNSIFIGQGAGSNDDLTTNRNIFIGDSAGFSNLTGNSNSAIGEFSLYSNTTGYSNIANGSYTLYLNTTGHHNIAIGGQALNSNTIGNYNSAIGYAALISNTTASRNIAIGHDALFQQSYDNSGAVWYSDNIAIGYQALYSNQPTTTLEGYQSVAIGNYALKANTTGARNTAIGHNTLYDNTTGTANTALGVAALEGNTTGEENTGIGMWALDHNTTATDNTAIGYSALESVTTGIDNTALGAYAYSNNSYSNSMALGANSYDITANNMVRLGNSSITSIGGKVGWTTLSDARVKTDVKEDVPGLIFINKLRPVTYYYDRNKENELTGAKDKHDWDGKYDIDKMQFSGFIAQEVDSVANKIGYTFSGVDKSGTLWGLRYDEFVVPLVKGMQEQQTMIENQNVKIEDLQNQVKVLQDKLDKLLDNK
jgi:trimeric autotransporter adhesin